MRRIIFVVFWFVLGFGFLKADVTQDRKVATKQLLALVENGDPTPEVVQDLLNQGADLNVKGPDGETAFQRELMGGCEARILAVFVNYHPDLNYQSSWGAGVVELAMSRNLDCAHILIEAGAPEDLADEDGLTPLMMVADQRPNERRDSV